MTFKKGKWCAYGWQFMFANQVRVVLIIWVNMNMTRLLNKLGFLNPYIYFFIKRANHVDSFIKFYKRKKKYKPNSSKKKNQIRWGEVRLGSNHGAWENVTKIENKFTKKKYKPNSFEL